MTMSKRALIFLAGVMAFQLEAQQKKFDPTNFIVVGEGLAAGMADFSLKDIYQIKSFPAQIAVQMNTSFPQALFQGTGIGNAPGFPEMPVRVPGPGQDSVRSDFPPHLFVFNLSVPGFRIEDSLGRRPSAPIVRPDDMTQTTTNLILGYPQLILKDKPLWTQYEYALQMNPTFAIVELGYFDILQAAVAGDLTQLPDTSAFSANYSKIVAGLKGTGATVMVTTVPDPTTTGYFTTIAGSTRLTGAPASVPSIVYGVAADDLLTASGVTALAARIEGSDSSALPAGSSVPAAAIAQIQQRVKDINAQITSIAQKNGALVYDLNDLFTRVRSTGVFAGTQLLTANYLGGFYSLDGYYPGETGQALIANEILNLINTTYGTAYLPLSLAAVAAADPTVKFAVQVEGSIR
jgi:hypothetical protein